MRWLRFLVLSSAALLMAVLGRAAFSGEIREGATVEAKANSIWFQDAGKLAQWQKLKAAGNAEALAAFEEEELSERNAWRFEPALSVKVLGFDPGENRASVEMLTPGRMQGTTWFIDPAALH
jgi:hypothetical protein